MKLLYTFILLSLFSISCEELDRLNPTESTVNPIIGVWEWTETILTTGSTSQTTLSDDDHTITYICGEDGTFSYQEIIEGDIESGGGTWSTTNGKLTMVVDGDTVILDFTINGNILSMINIVEEDDVTYNLELRFIKQ